MIELLAQESPPAVSAAAQGPSAGERIVQGLLAGQAVIGIGLILGLGLALLVWSRMRPRVERGAFAGERRRTATFLMGAGATLGWLVVWSAVERTRNAWVIGAFVTAFFYFVVLGFAADALRTGRRLTGQSGTRALAIGWVVRASALFVPLAWPVLGIYLLVSALGNPLVALFGVTGNDTTTPSDGSSAER